MDQYLTTEEKLDFIIDILRVNRLHQSECATHDVDFLEKEKQVCDCWLSEPPGLPPLEAENLRIDFYRPAVPQSTNVDTQIRITYLPTGHTTSASNRSGIQAKKEALKALTELVAEARGEESKK